MRTLPNLDQIDRLLIVKSSSIGDIVHALPVVEAIKTARPNLTIGWVVRKRCADVLTGNPFIDHLHIVENKPKFGDLLRLRRELHEQRYQCALDMQGLFLSGVYALLSGARVRIGLDRNRENNKLFMTHPIVLGKPEGRGAPDRHAVDILYGFAELLGVWIDRHDFPAQPYLAEGASEKLMHELREAKGPKVALNVGASSKYKQWPPEHWSSLASSLAATGRIVVFVGDKRDGVVVKDVIAGMQTTDGVIDLSGKTKLRQLAAVLRECDVVVTGDTGPMHIAVAVGTPVIAMFGSTNPDRTGPYGRRNVVLNMHLPCSPCYRRPTCQGRVDCMREITPDGVLGAVERKLQSLNA
jgi:lipopolysaccharide heptosyltransferase I